MSTTREVSVDIGGKSYMMTSDDDYLGDISTGFEPESVRLFNALVRQGDVVLDVGANIGCTALLFGERSKEVYAFEPSETTFAFLKRNVDRSGLRNVFPQNFGLGSEPGEYELTFAPSNRSGGFVSNQTNAGAGYTKERIRIRQMDAVVEALKLPGVDFIKIDVEGFEGQVLRGGLKTITAHRPLVTAELNHWCLNAFQRTSVPDFLDFLRSVFPILLAVDSSGYMDLHDESDSYNVMYHHIIHMRFHSIVGAFDEGQLVALKAAYQHQFVA